jgi:hypothetical protein
VCKRIIYRRNRRNGERGLGSKDSERVWLIAKQRADVMKDLISLLGAAHIFIGLALV